MRAKLRFVLKSKIVGYEKRRGKAKEDTKRLA